MVPDPLAQSLINNLSKAALDQWLLWTACTVSIFYLIFLYHVNHCRVQIKIVVVVVIWIVFFK